MKTPTARVSARTEKMEFSQTYGTKYCIPTWLRDEQVRIAIKKVSGRLVPHEGLRQDPVAVVGFGPSLQKSVDEIRTFPYIITCSGAHKFLIDRGIIPTWHVEVDPRDHKIGLLGPADKRVTYLPSSTSHPKYLDHLLASGADVRLWHVFTNEEEGSRILPQGEWMVAGGADAGLRSLVMARLLGFVDIHVFGIDGSSNEQNESHASTHPNAPGKFFKCEYPEKSGQFFNTTPALLSCAKSFPHEVGQLKDATVTFHGEGLVQTIMKHSTRKAPAAADLAFQKPSLITADYRELNRQLHVSNPLYGTSGVKHIETVLKLAEGIKTQSILDYGCGKGLLAKGLPFPIWEYDPAIEGKDELPRPADLVVCTDVLEHIEPDLLKPVLADLARCVKKVGYFVVHTGPAVKKLTDGRNAHLIQQGKAWWEKVLGKFFDVAKIVEEGAALKVVVGPKLKKPIPAETIVTHLGTSVTFKTPNETTHWRANSLFTKEPVTIEWIESFQPGEILWDVGANVGGYTVWAGARKGIEVYAFEPEANNYAILCENIRLNHTKGLAYCVAISDQVKSSTLYCSQAMVGSSCHTFGQDVGFDLQPREGVKQGAIGMTLDQLSTMLPFPTHIKIDVDGLEHAVIAGGKQFFADTRLQSILIEVNNNLAEHRAMLEVLTGLGFSYDQAQVERSTRKDGAFKGCAEYVFRRHQAVERYVLDKIEQADIRQKPFPHLIITDILPPETYAQLLAALPPDAQYRPLAERGTNGYPERSTHAAPSFLAWMTSGTLRAALDKKFGVQSSSDETLLLRDKPGYAIPPHTDTPAKAVTMLVYLGNSRHGTTLYTPKAKGYTDPKGLHHKFQLFRKYGTAEGAPNSALIFARTDSSFHGTTPWGGPGVRDVLLYDSKTVAA